MEKKWKKKYVRIKNFWKNEKIQKSGNWATGVPKLGCCSPNVSKFLHYLPPTKKSEFFIKCFQKFDSNFDIFTNVFEHYSKLTQNFYKISPYFSKFVRKFFTQNSPAIIFWTIF